MNAPLLPEETPVALVVDGATQAVMMTTPADLEDFARGFALTEGVIEHPRDLREIEIVPQERGIEARLWLTPARAQVQAARRRSMMGPVGCGLCGIDSLAQALRPLPVLPAGGLSLGWSEIAAAPDALRAHQPLHDATRATHAAGLVLPGRGVVLAREDVGRHNALDKLIGAALAAGLGPGAVVMTSRVSVELVQKAVLAGLPMLIAVSAPTQLAVEQARAAGLTLIARHGATRAHPYAHPDRIAPGG